MSSDPIRSASLSCVMEGDIIKKSPKKATKRNLETYPEAKLENNCCSLEEADADTLTSYRRARTECSAIRADLVMEPESAAAEQEGSVLENQGDIPISELRLPYAIHSLVVQKRRIIEGILFEFDHMHTLILVIQTLTSAQAQHLKRLEITRNITGTRVAAEYPYLNDAFELISLCVNLEVLHMDAWCIETPYYNYLMTMDLSQLLKLKGLKFNRVAFKNFQAPGLVELECQNMRLTEDDDCDAFRQMIIAISSSIEVLHLNLVTLNECESDDDMDSHTADDVGIKMPKLRQLTLYNSEIPGCVVNLSESTFLSSVNMLGTSLDIINFDLSVHCLDRFDVSFISRLHQTDIVDQFITSAIDNADHFCLLKELVIIVSDLPSLNDLFNSISPLTNYSFKKFHLSDVNNIENLMPSNLLVLVNCSPDLERIVVPNFVLDKKCLIDIIISKMRIVDIDFYLELDRIEGGNELTVLSDLYNALNTSNICTKERQSDIIVTIFRVDMDDNDKELICLVKKIADNFRVFFTLG